MELIWAPWRIEYIHQEPEPGCIFCNRLNRKRDRQDLILYRGERIFIMLNRFPYNSGHLLISPNQHTNNLALLSPQTLLDLFQAIIQSQEILQKLFHPDGFNLGMNLGHAGGAGIVDHLHFHLVPRWVGDTNFMPVLAEVKVIPDHLDRTYRLLRPAFNRWKKVLNSSKTPRHHE